MPCRTGFRVSNASGFRARVSFRRRRPRGRKRSETRSVSLKPRLGNIATPGRVCPPHNETYDCRIYPNGIGCLRRGGGSGTGRPTGQEPAFRTDSASERDGLPVRSVRFPIRASRTLRRLAYSGYAAGKRERKERERDEAPPGAASVRRRTGPPGDRIENAAGERPEHPRVRLGLAELGSAESPGGLQFRQRAGKRERTERRETNSPGIVSVRRCTAPRATEPEMRPGRETGASASPARPCGARERGKLVRPVSGQYGSAFPGRNAGRTRNICQTRLHTLLHQPFWEVFSAHTSRWLETLWHGAGWKMHALGTFGILMHIIGRPNTSPYRNPDKKQGSFL